MGAVRLARLAHKASKLLGGRGIAQLIKDINRIIYSCDIAYQVDIPASTSLPHQGLGVVMHPNTIIGDNCTIYQNTCFGASHGDENIDGAPVIGSNVQIGVGAVILGPIHIGSNVSIGANSVVLDDVSDNTVVAGVPARIKKYKESM